MVRTNNNRTAIHAQAAFAAIQHGSQHTNAKYILMGQNSVCFYYRDKGEGFCPSPDEIISISHGYYALMRGERLCAYRMNRGTPLRWQAYSLGNILSSEANTRLILAAAKSAGTGVLLKSPEGEVCIISPNSLIEEDIKLKARGSYRLSRKQEDYLDSLHKWKDGTASLCEVKGGQPLQAYEIYTSEITIKNIA